VTVPQKHTRQGTELFENFQLFTKLSGNFENYYK
jgi:hypothetical protein